MSNSGRTLNSYSGRYKNHTFERIDEGKFTIVCPLCKVDSLSELDSGLSQFEATFSQIKGGVRICRCSRSYNKEEMEVYVKHTLLSEGSVFERWSSNRSGGGLVFYYTCPRGHKVKISNGNFKQGKRCVKCRDIGTSERRSTSSQTWKRRLEEESIYRGSSTFIRSCKVTRKVYYRCDMCSVDEYFRNGLCNGIFSVGHETLKAAKVKTCRCGGAKPLTTSQMIFKLDNILEASNKYVVDLDYKSNRSLVTVNCKNLNHRYQLTVGNLLAKGYRCSICDERSFGFDGSLPCKLYLVKWSNEDEDYIKVGITRNSVEDRICNQRIKTELKPSILKVFNFHTGFEAKRLEGLCVKILGRGSENIDKSIFGDGYTETFKYDEENISEVISLLSTGI